MAVATTDPSVLSKPAAIVPSLLWPIVVAVLFVVAQLYPDDSTTIDHEFDETAHRLLARD